MKKNIQKSTLFLILISLSIGISIPVLANGISQEEVHYMLLPVNRTYIGEVHYKLLPINHIYIDDVEQTIPVELGEAYTDNNWRTLIPLRFISEKLGHDINWDESSKEIKIDNGNISLKVNDHHAVVHGTKILMDTAPLIDENRTYVPLRFISEALGYQVEYKVDGVQSYIYIYTKK